MIRMTEIEEPEYMEAPEGRLEVSVFKDNYVTPISNALVSIYTTYDEAPEAVNTSLYDLTTNESGKTAEVTLPTPPEFYSEVPEEGKPFAEYAVYVRAEGYEDVVIRGAQVFPNTLAIQNVSLVPVSIETGEREIIVPYPKLWGDHEPKIPEEEVKEIPESSGLVVLNQVVIPEYIVVHDGRPDDNTAPNYYIPFKDYIKNVASSEIYATWPDAAIRANTLAIISFTLNRVYTEWYRSRGKNFTITSSTAYDHFFVYGRNIYEEINVIVDEMFTTYIKRYGANQPLFAQYCDGVRVYCPTWLSQWGCKDLADKGYNAIQILRHYYGDDIYLENATKVSGIPQSYPGTALQEGSTGEDVRTIQNQLNTISKTYTSIPTLKVDGVYGEETVRAVIAFQGIFNLPQTGIVDFSTWYEISRMYVSLAKLAEL